MNINEINNDFKMGDLPACFNYKPKKLDEVDFSKLQYNSYYKSPEFMLSKFSNPTAFLNMAGGLQILELMAENSPCPLEAMIERQRFSQSFHIEE
jgi:hypothetical protein